MLYFLIDLNIFCCYVVINRSSGTNSCLLIMTSITVHYSNISLLSTLDAKKISFFLSLDINNSQQSWQVYCYVKAVQINCCNRNKLCFNLASLKVQTLQHTEVRVNTSIYQVKLLMNRFDIRYSMTVSPTSKPHW